jgi:hypothetical protein
VTSHRGCIRNGYAYFPLDADSGFMHKLILTLRKVAAVEQPEDEPGDSTQSDEDLVFLVGPRAASFSVERPMHSRAVLQKMSAAR